MSVFLGITIGVFVVIPALLGWAVIVAGVIHGRTRSKAKSALLDAIGQTPADTTDR